MKGELRDFRATAEALREAWVSRGTSSGAVPVWWRWASHGADLRAAVGDSRRALEWAWARGVPRRARLAPGVDPDCIGSGVVRLRAALEGLGEPWSAEHDAQLRRSLARRTLAVDAVNLVRSHASLEELDALAAEGHPENLRVLIDLGRCIKAFELLGSEDASESVEAADAAVLRGDRDGFLDRDVQEELFGSPSLRGLRRRAARLGGRAWATECIEAPPAWVARLLEGEARVRRSVAWFYAEWVIAQARAVSRKISDPAELSPLLGCARRLQRARTAINVTDTEWPVRVVRRLQEELGEVKDSYLKSTP